MRFARLLGFKLFVIVLVTIAVGTGIFATFSIDWHSRHYLHNKIQSVTRMSDVLNRSMHYSMLLNRREDIFQIITTVGNEPGLEVVRIYNKRGEISFSSDSSEVGSTVSLGDNACKACHHSGTSHVEPAPGELTRIFPARDGYRILGMITPIRNESSCATASCHAHPASQTILGVLDVMVPLKDLDASLADLRQVQYVSAISMVVLLTSFAGAFIWLMVNRPVQKLIQGTDEIRKGNLRHRIEVKSRDEIGFLANSFNHMAEELHRARHELTEWNQTLEKRIRQKTDELGRAHAHMIQMEKMVSLGTLAATVAHELNNPLEGVLTYAKLVKRKMASGELTPEQRSEILEELSTIADETARCGNIVKNLLLFSRQKVGEFRSAELRTIIEQSGRLVEHHLKMHDITLVKALGTVPLEIECDPDQLEQALLAIEINAVEAMPGGGTLAITATRQPDADAVEIVIQDTGVGIRDEDLPHIFEPFYTTKQDGKGTGLGLAVVYGIIERHGGTIRVHSVVHQGSTFVCVLPCKHTQPGTPS